MTSKIALASLLVVTLLGISVEGGHHQSHNGWGWDEYSHPKYKFSYGVNDKHTWDQKHASEWRDGDKVGGQYSLKEPDGTWRTVTYWADKGGFRANVHRTGWNSHPHHHGGHHKGGHHYSAGGHH